MTPEPGVYELPGDTYHVVPVHYGPVWDRDANGDFLLPEWTLGWQIDKWVTDNLASIDGTEGGFKFTQEQLRFVLWWYAVDENGQFAFRDGILERLKGWGKDPLVAVLCFVELIGPCRFGGWALKDMPEIGVSKGEPLGVDCPTAWIQVAAVSKEQTVNTAGLFPILVPKDSATAKKYQLDLGKELSYAFHGQRRIQCVTSSPRSLEGGRPTFVIRNETQHWLKNNEGHAMASVIDRNATKIDGRALSVTNAYSPSEDSVAKRQHESWKDEQSGMAIKTGVLYDSLQAPPDALLRPLRRKNDEGEFLETAEDYEARVRRYIAAVLMAVRGDSVWLKIDRLVNSILDKRNPPSDSRRFWYSQVVAVEDAWLDPEAVTRAKSRLAAEARDEQPDDILRAGWIVTPDEPIVMFGDGSKSDDATALVGCRVSDGYLFLLGCWQRPARDQSKKTEPVRWLAPREEVDARVAEAHRRFNVVGFFFDPSHAKDDDDASKYWDSYVDKWHREYSDRYQAWAIRSGHRKSSVMWDMASPERQKLFVEAAELFVEEMQNLNDIEQYAPLIVFDGHPIFVEHLLNARTYPTIYGDSLIKEHRESNRKIDVAVCAVGARMVRRFLLNQGLEDEEPERSGHVWGV